MFRNYIKTSLRFFKQNKLFAGINILGLSIALAASFIILLFVINELSYNRCHKNRKQVYKVLNYYVDFKNTMAGTPYILATALKEEFPQIQKAARTRRINGLKLKLNDELIELPNAVGADSEIFDIFTLPMVGNQSDKELLDEPNAIILSSEQAEKFFPQQDPVGKEMRGFVNNHEQAFIVKGVFENIPVNSTFKAQCFLNTKWTVDDMNVSFNVNDSHVSWDKDFWTTWLLLSPDADPNILQQQFRDFEKKHLGEKPIKNYSLQNLSDIYLGSSQVLNAGITGKMSNVRLFSAIAALIVLVAALNFIILSTAVSTGRSKEIGIRKTSGASINSIKIQLLIESVLLSFLVLPLALILARTGLPYAGMLFQTKFEIIPSNILFYCLIYLGLVLFIGIASGLYTSAYLSRLKVMDVLRNTPISGNKKQVFRSSLIVIQLVIFCSFLASTLIIRSQYQFALKKDLGYSNKDIVLVDFGRGFKEYSTYINNIKANPNIIMAGGTMEGLPMMSSMTMMIPNFQDNNQKVEVEGMSVDYNFLKTMGMLVLDGRDFSEEFVSDITQSAILNKTAVNRLGISDPVGKKIGNTLIIGVIDDFNLHSIRTDIPPLMITMTNRYINQVAIRYQPGSLNTLLPFLEKEWKKVAPDRPFSHSTIEEMIEKLYSTEKNLSIIVTIFAMFTLLIASFGLFGLTLFIAQSRTKEIGIKKVFGSNSNTIIYSFIKENLLMVFIASALSVPVTIYVMTKWLNNFSYHTTISWWVFFVAFATAAMVVLSTVFIQSFKASRINPVEALRYE
ncbi:MAG TPA: FtsX-like permease family protein [Prolixibacteraceae bacterium]|nr:FtsX-like permease family protein [Prolixibacteraceae bacterium]